MQKSGSLDYYQLGMTGQMNGFRIPIIIIICNYYNISPNRRFTVPMETFFDAEDGTNLKLTLLDKADQPLKANSWIQFDADKREVYGL